MRNRIAKLHSSLEVGRILSYQIDTRRLEIVLVPADNGGVSDVIKLSDLDAYLDAQASRTHKLDEATLMYRILMAGGIPSWSYEDARPNIDGIEIESNETYARFLERAYLTIRPMKPEDGGVADLLAKAASGKIGGVNLFRSVASDKSSLRIHRNGYPDEYSGTFEELATILERAVYGRTVERMSYNECVVEITQTGHRIEFDQAPYALVKGERISMSPDQLLLDFVREVVSKIREA